MGELSISKRNKLQESNNDNSYNMNNNSVNKNILVNSAYYRKLKEEAK